MTPIIYTLLIGLYLFLTLNWARRFISRSSFQKEMELGELKGELKELEEKKESLYKEKLSLEAEAVSIFTLYEITKDITKTLNEKQAFETFKIKLSEHVKFCECRLVDEEDVEIASLQKNADYFLFLLKIKEKKIGYLVVKGVSETEKEIVIILATQFVLALRRVELYQEIEKIAITDSLTEVNIAQFKSFAI